LEGPAAAAMVENEYQVIEDAEIIEIKTNKMGRD
jgi:hypothetical protein